MRDKLGLIPGILMIGMAGGVTGICIISDVGFAFMTMIAAMISGACAIVLFGRDGAAGWGWALLGGILATVGASSAFGIVLNFAEAYAFPMHVGATLYSEPYSGVFWVISMSLAHLVTRRWREGQKSHFSGFI